jgi:hypothetical protein
MGFETLHRLFMIEFHTKAAAFKSHLRLSLLLKLGGTHNGCGRGYEENKILNFYGVEDSCSGLMELHLLSVLINLGTWRKKF